MYVLVKDIVKNIITYFNKIKIELWKLHYYLRYKNHDGIEICKSSNFHNKVRMLFRREGSVKIGSHTNFQRDSRIVIDGGNLSVGDNCSFGEQNILNVFDNVIIGNKVLTADKVNLISNIHVYDDVTMAICDQKTLNGPISIGDGTWIGINSTILANTTIGKNCVVGANSVVKGKFPDYSVIVGAPAHIVKQYDLKMKKWKNVKHL